LVKTLQQSIGKCLSAVAGEVVQMQAGTAGAVGVCTGLFAKLGPNAAAAKFDAKVAAKCDPAPVNPHTLDDLLGSGVPAVAEPLKVSNLDAYCAHFGGDGSIDTAAEWRTCVRNALSCSAYASIAAEFPRALEWLNQIGAVMPAGDAKNALMAVESAIDGANDDNIPSLQCGSTCEDGLRTAQEQCDGTDLGGATCASLGYLSGALACTAGCAFDTSGCVPVSFNPAAFPVTGQTTCWDSSGTVIPCAGTGQDGEVRAGAAFSFLDRGDGTITDLRTGLMWEKKSSDGGIHDKDATYSWDQAFSLHVAALNAMNFAGHSDWRVPNIKELMSIVDQGTSAPALPAAFNAGCANGCTVLDCSCPAAYGWSSTTHVLLPSYAWFVTFDNGRASSTPTAFAFSVRAVRGVP
jgi:hypothetical protein